MESNTNRYEQEITIRKEDIDEQGHVNNVVYLRWVQDVAAAHWNSLATEEMKREHAWVVSRHEIDYLKPSFFESRLKAQTWVGNSEGARSERYVEIIDIQTQKPVARVKTTWTLLDAKSKRPKRVEEQFISLFK